MRIHLFGPFQIYSEEGAALTISSTRIQFLLAYLIFRAETSHSRQQLAFQFWPETTDSQSRANLRTLLYRIRREIPEWERLIAVDDLTVSWRGNPQVGVDYLELKTLTGDLEQSGVDDEVLLRIVDRLDSELLPICHEDWILPIRRELGESLRTALRLLMDRNEERRAYQNALRYAWRYLESDPLDEGAYQRLIRLHILTGNRTEARRLFEQCSEMLQSEFGVAPSKETEELGRRLRHFSRYRVENPEAERSPTSSQQLVGRHSEWAQILGLWQKALSGDPSLLLLSGSAGIGKTRFANEFVEWVSLHDGLAAVTRAHPLQGTMAFAPLAELLRSRALWPRVGDLGRPWLQQLCRICPELLESHPDLVPPGPMVEPWHRLHFQRALSQPILTVEEPLLLLFDDLHWSDTFTIEWISQLLHETGDRRLLVMATIRSEEVSGDESRTQLIQRLRQSEHLIELELKPLSTEECVELAQGAVGDAAAPQTVDQIVSGGEGNPFFTLELARNAHLAQTEEVSAQSNGEIPPRIHTLLRYRLSQLSPQAENLARIAAILNQTFTGDLLNQIAHPHTNGWNANAAAEIQRGFDDRFVDAFEELLEREILEEYEYNRFDFSHGMLRRVVLAEIGSVRRRHIHHLVADGLSHQSIDQQIQNFGVIAEHYLVAGQEERAMPYLFRAGMHSLRLLAFDDGIHYLTRGLEISERSAREWTFEPSEIQVLTALGLAYSAVHGSAAPIVAETYTKAANCAEKTGDDSLLIPVYLGMGAHHLVRGELDQVSVQADLALLAARRGSDEKMLMLANFGSGVRHYFLGELDEAVGYFQKAIRLHRPEWDHELLVQFGYHAKLQSFGFLAISLEILGRLDEAEQIRKTGLRLARRLDHAPTYTNFLYLTSVFFQIREDVERALQLSTEVLQLAMEHQIVEVILPAQMIQGWALARSGETSTGIQQIEQSLAHMLQRGVRLSRAFYLYLMADAHFAAGNIDEALKRSTECLTQAAQSSRTFLQTEYLRQMAQIGERMPQGSVDTIAIYRQSLQLATEQNTQLLSLKIATDLARLQAQQGDPAGGYELLQPIYASFETQAESQQSRRARTLLQELSHRVSGT